MDKKTNILSLIVSTVLMAFVTTSFIYSLTHKNVSKSLKKTSAVATWALVTFMTALRLKQISCEDDADTTEE